VSCEEEMSRTRPWEDNDGKERRNTPDGGHVAEFTGRTFQAIIGPDQIPSTREKVRTKTGILGTMEKKRGEGGFEVKKMDLSNNYIYEKKKKEELLQITMRKGAGCKYGEDKRRWCRREVNVERGIIRL